MRVPAARMGCAVLGVPAALNSPVYWVISMITSTSESGQVFQPGREHRHCRQGEPVHLAEQVQQRLLPCGEPAAGVVEPGQQVACSRQPVPRPCQAVASAWRDPLCGLAGAGVNSGDEEAGHDPP
jgi:hypothetical protein